MPGQKAYSKGTVKRGECGIKWRKKEGTRSKSPKLTKTEGEVHCATLLPLCRETKITLRPRKGLHGEEFIPSRGERGKGKSEASKGRETQKGDEKLGKPLWKSSREDNQNYAAHTFYLRLAPSGK